MAPMRSRCAWVTSTAEASPDAMVAAAWAGVSFVRSATALLLVQHARNAEPLVFCRRRATQRGFGRERGPYFVGAKHVDAGRCDHLLRGLDCLRPRDQLGGAHCRAG